MNDGTNTYTYDDNGNLTQKVEPSLTTDYIYDAENQLVEIKENTTTIGKYRYDGLGRRIEKDVSGNLTRYVYDNEDIVLEYNGSNVLQASYTHGQGIDEPLIMERGGNSFFYHADGLGSIVDLTDNLSAVVQSYVYDSFGNIVLQNGSLINLFTYTGREFDEESGLYYYRARYYDASIGRFIQEDPLDDLIKSLGDLNFYVYVHNNPIKFVDNDGLNGSLFPDPPKLGPNKSPSYPRNVLCSEYPSACPPSEFYYVSDFSGDRSCITECFKEANFILDSAIIANFPSASAYAWAEGLGKLFECTEKCAISCPAVQ